MDRERARARPSGANPPLGGRSRGRGTLRTARAAVQTTAVRRALCFMGVVVISVVVLMAGWVVSGDPGATTAAAVSPAAVSPAAVSPQGRGALTLLSQSAVVQPGQSFDLHLKVAASAGPTSGLGVTVAVYPCLSSLSSFDQSVASGPVGVPISQTSSPLPLSSLPTVAGGGVDVSLPVTVGSSSGPVIHLTPSSGQCRSYPSGVYPVRVALVATAGSGSADSGATVSSFTTHLVYTEATQTTQRLRVGVVLPLQLTQRASVAPSSAELRVHPESALTPQFPDALENLDGTVTSIAEQHAGVPVTLQVSGQALGALAAPGHEAALSRLAQLAASPTVHQITVAPYVPVDAAALVGSGLQAELALQIARGAQSVAAATDTAVPEVAAGFGPWIAGGSLDGATVSALIADGYQQAVLPSAALSGSPAVGSTTQPVVVGDGRGSSIVAMPASNDLTLRFVDVPGNPVLAAHQLVAELAQLYYERPNGTSPRAVVAAGPLGWKADPAFVDALLGSLTSNPVAEPITLTQLFSLFPSTTTCRTGCRLATPVTTTGLPVTAIRSERLRVNGFASSAQGQHELSQRLGDLVLGAESLALRPNQQASVASASGSALDAQLSQLAITGDREITLTARSGRVPVTVVSNAPYTITGALSLSSDKLLFPNGAARWTTPVTLLPRHTNVIYVQVQSRASGTFKLAVALRSTDGALRLAGGTLTVRSTTTSVVGIVLSVGAVVVLGAWWIRTSLRRRAARRAEDQVTDDPRPTGSDS